MATGDDIDEKTRGYLKLLGNPYASLSILCAIDESTSANKEQRIGQVTTAMRQSLSKRDFRSGCARIFSQYVPSEKGRALRTHHREFIAKNENCSAEERFNIFALLKKYDISDQKKYKPHFNRERDVFTIAKL